MEIKTQRIKYISFDFGYCARKQLSGNLILVSMLKSGHKCNAIKLNLFYRSPWEFSIVITYQRAFHVNLTLNSDATF